MNVIEPKYKYKEIEKVFEKLISGNAELTEHFTKEVNLTDYNQVDNIPYVDIGSISRFIVEKKLENQTSDFDLLFENIEDVYINGDKDVRNFITVGLFEGIQNIGGEKIEYHHSFNEWLKTETQNAWNGIIDYWEGTEWRIPKDKREKREKEIQKILNKK
ncbi:hypothetical protein GCM10011531_19200 [Aquaticitalea lipolytica]|uniref:DUF7674 domain-containing protein n=1 Tax=Aquaticitalea lipolytica TaxID=1247562 RepID=A0A8J2TPW6_9FLAO|nr:hypothetical protein [Aquaticitalea lipolytica]GFZ87824.1 hypothetical protein GCM10011531_19200 [Aquaticitalea lipolytica]